MKFEEKQIFKKTSFYSNFQNQLIELWKFEDIYQMLSSFTYNF